MMSLHNMRPKRSKAPRQKPEANNLPQLPFADSPVSVQPDPENLIQVPLNLRYHSFNYTQVCRGGKSCIYQQMVGRETVGYEVFKILKEPETTLFGKVIPEHERFPSDGDFGNSAWSYFTLEDAMQRYNKLER